MLGDIYDLLHMTQQEGKNNYQHMYVSVDIANEAWYAVNYKCHPSEHTFAVFLTSNKGNKWSN